MPRIEEIIKGDLEAIALEIDVELLRKSLEVEKALREVEELFQEVEKGRIPALPGETRTFKTDFAEETQHNPSRHRKQEDGSWKRERDENIGGRTDTTMTREDPPPSGRGSNYY